MKIFDQHCDTLTAAMRENCNLMSFSGHINLKKAEDFERYAQIFAIFVPDSMRPEDGWAYFLRSQKFYNSQLPHIEKLCTPLLSLENANNLNNDIERIKSLKQMGVRAVTLTWNGENCIGYGASCDAHLPLKPFGLLAVEALQKSGIIADVSHLNTAGFWQVTQFSQPIFASHSNAYAVTPHPRNLSDDQLKAVFKSGGLVGLNFFKEFLGHHGDSAAFARHLLHMLRLGGEDSVAIGSDFDGCAIDSSLAGLEKIPYLDCCLSKIGINSELREKLFWGNAAKFWHIK